MKKILKCISLLLASALLFTACAVRGPQPSDQHAPETAQAQSAREDDDSDNTIVPDAGGAGGKAELPASSSIADGVVPLAVTRGGNISDVNLTIPTTFQITRPDEDLTTSYSSYFITGTSNPNQTLYMGSTEIQRQGSLGTWGVLVSLQNGRNTFTFRQGDETKTVTITRQTYGASAISEIVQSSMYPSIQGGVKVGEHMLVECIAPSGGTVVATFEGRSVTLQQVSQASAGIPATYRGQLLVEGDYQTGATNKIGKVTYQLTYGGKTSSYESTGDMYVAGVGSRIAVEVTNYIGFVYPSTNQLSQFKEKLKLGATDYVESEDDEYFQLASGGYLPKGQAAIIEGEVNIQNSLAAVSIATASGKETYTFQGTSATAFATSVQDNTFRITLYNTNGTPAANTAGSQLFASASATDNGGSVTYAFPMSNPGRYWGYNVSFSGGNLQLRFQYKPTINAGAAQPLQGVTIMLDPGHGGDDTGALGVAAGVGPNEADINLAHAYATRDRLTALGANVLLTHAGEGAELDERLQYFEESEAHLFLSLHHNSVGENVDANTARGMEVYYHTGTSATPAATMMRALDSAISRNNRRVQQSYYRVTLIPQAPSMLLELGFMSNPYEYERLTNRDEINNAAQAIANGVVNIFR